MDSSLKIRELEMTVQRLLQRVTVLESAAQAKSGSKWLTPNSAAAASNGRYTDYLIRVTIDRAIASPSSTRLEAGKHYSKVQIGTCRWRYKVYWPDFDNLVQEASSLED